ncbi:MAG: D-cysteine desulfhydrase family protein [Deltaproteobacteria bacterium]|jgi:D-cysteine desulfhydrase|nr:D-cysteine desulfhydrase family protein [Deltaproteobacteria bacterium]
MKPKKYNLAYLPTPLEKLEAASREYGVNLLIKRDDMSGMELSGNKVRKLEYLLYDAVQKGCDTILTYGGCQSNHARATVVAAAKLGLACVLILDNTYQHLHEGNLFLDRLLGADIRFVDSAVYDSPEAVAKVEAEVIREYESRGKKVYPVPIGASNGLGSLGYADEAEELLEQCKKMNFPVDCIVDTIGSAGTYSGLLYGLKKNGYAGRCLAISIAYDAEACRKKVLAVSQELNAVLGTALDVSDLIEVWDEFVGAGYALTTKENMAFIHKFAKDSGIFLDPVYTGKAFDGFFQALKAGRLKGCSNIVLIHTGGLFGYRQDQRDLLKY